MFQFSDLLQIGISLFHSFRCSPLFLCPTCNACDKPMFGQGFLKVRIRFSAVLT